MDWEPPSRVQLNSLRQGAQPLRGQTRGGGGGPLKFGHQLPPPQLTVRLRPLGGGGFWEGCRGGGEPETMSNGYKALIHPRDTGIWSSPPFSVHCFVLLHCSAIQISSECCLEVPRFPGRVSEP